MNRNESDARFTCGNWDHEVRIQRQGPHHGTLKRKVMTKGIVHVRAARILEGIVRSLRKGYEVRLTDGGENDAIRIFPIASMDCRRMYVRTQAMGGFRHEAYRGRSLAFTSRRGARRVGRDEVDGRVGRTLAERDGRVHVSPDTVVACPRCGFEFRVGKKLS